jgi:oxygen-independent coproporphyrinogen-3 oxidase
LIYGLPRQSVASFQETLDKTIAMGPDRLAVYSFAYLPSLKANQQLIKEVDLPSTDVKYGLFAAAIEKFTAAGYQQIGMDHFAKPDDELSLAQTDGRLHRNFMGYTVKSAPEMIGFGMSSIGYINNSFFQNHSGIDSYKNAVRDSGFAVYRGKLLSHDDLVRQSLITSLMCNFTLDIAALNQSYGIAYTDYFANEIRLLSEFDEDRFLERGSDRLDITPIGRTFVRNIAMKFDAYLDGQGQTRFSRTI